MLKKKPIIEKIKSVQSNVPLNENPCNISINIPDVKGIISQKLILPAHRIKIIDVKEYTHNPSGNEK
jgi:hypothetical protein